MPSQPPALVTLYPDDGIAKYVGHAADGRQFFLTNPFASHRDPSVAREFLALYLFDAQGALVEARIEDLGSRAGLDVEAARRLRAQWLAELGSVRRHRTQIAPFEIERFGEVFGFVARPPEGDDPDESWAVEVMPGNYMAFFEPFDSGNYDT